MKRSHELEEKRKEEEKKDLDNALKVRMREVEKIERVRLESQMKCEKDRAQREMEEMRRHFEEENRKRAEEEKRRSCELESKRREEDGKRGYEEAKKALDKAKADIERFEKGGNDQNCGSCPKSAPAAPAAPATPAAPAAAPQSNAQTQADDAELEKKKKEADELIAKLKAKVDEADKKKEDDKKADDKKADEKKGDDKKGDDKKGDEEKKSSGNGEKKAATDEAGSKAEKLIDDIEATIKSNIADEFPKIAKEVAKVIKQGGIPRADEEA